MSVAPFGVRAARLAAEREDATPGAALLLALATAGSPAVEVPFVGITVHSLDVSRVPQYAAAGFRVVRTDLAWDHVELTRGAYSWYRYDPFIAALRTHGITPLLILGYGNDLYDGGLSPRDAHAVAAFARFAGEAAARYPRSIWEIWNEPNVPESWRRAPDPEAYAVLVAAASAAIRRADPQAVILGLSMGGSQFDADYAGRAFRAGLLDSVDAVAVHPYAAAVPEEAPALYLTLRQLMGREERPLVVSEWGHPSSASSEEDQADRTVRMLRIDEAQGIGLTVLYDWQDDGTDPHNYEHHFGLLRCDDTPKPVYHAVVDELR
jgi:hypothetical protein